MPTTSTTSESVSTPRADAPRAPYVIQPQPLNPSANSASFATKINGAAEVVSGSAPPKPLHVATAHVMFNGLLALVVPCVPMAQIASTVGHNYIKTLTAFAAVFAAAIATAVAAASTSSSAIAVDTWAEALGMQWLLYAVGPWVTVTGFFNLQYFLMIVRDYDHASALSSTYFGLNVLCNFALVIGVWLLRRGLRRVATSATPRCGWQWDCLAATCCACCTLTSMLTAVKEATDAPVLAVGPLDVLPAYTSTDSERV